MDRQSLKGHMASNVRRGRQRQSHASGMHREGRSSRCPWAGLLLFPSKFVVQVSASEDPFLGFSFLSPSSVSLSGEQHRTAWRRIKTMVVPLHLVGLCALCPTSPPLRAVRIEPKVSHILGKCSTTEQQPYFSLFILLRFPAA